MADKYEYPLTDNRHTFRTLAKEKILRHFVDEIVGLCSHTQYLWAWKRFPMIHKQGHFAKNMKTLRVDIN